MCLCVWWGAHAIAHMGRQGGAHTPSCTWDVRGWGGTYAIAHTGRQRMGGHTRHRAHGTSEDNPVESVLFPHPGHVITYFCPWTISLPPVISLTSLLMLVMSSVQSFLSDSSTADTPLPSNLFHREFIFLSLYYTSTSYTFPRMHIFCSLECHLVSQVWWNMPLNSALRG